MRLRPFLLAFVITSCIDTKGAIEDVTNKCRTVVQEEIPNIVTQVAIATISACNGLQMSVDNGPVKVSELVLSKLGCYPNGDGTWDCSQSNLCGLAIPDAGI